MCLFYSPRSHCPTTLAIEYIIDSSHCLLAINSSVNFFIYILRGGRFREVILQVSTQPLLILSGKRESGAYLAHKHKICALRSNLVAHGRRELALAGAWVARACYSSYLASAKVLILFCSFFVQYAKQRKLIVFQNKVKLIKFELKLFQMFLYCSLLGKYSVCKVF